jgi:magnesium transporter
MLTAFIMSGNGQVSRDTSPEALIRAVRDPETVFWLDMQKPDDEELALLDDIFGFHPLAIEDTIGYSQRPKIESYNHVGDACRSGYFYMVFHGPDLQSFREKLRTKELDLFVSDRYLVTIHEEDMRSVQEIRSRAEGDPRRVLERGTDVLLYSILDHMVDHYEPILDYLQEALDDLEERALVKPRPEVLTEISIKKRELLNLRRIVAPQREVVAQLTRGDVPFIREGTRVFMRDVQDHLIRIVEMVELYRDLVVGARDIYLSSISNRLNEIMKTLTMITVFAIPFTVITGFFGMNFENVPGFNHALQSSWGFALMLLCTGAIVAGIFYWFYRKGWLRRDPYGGDPPPMHHDDDPVSERKHQSERSERTMT